MELCEEERRARRRKYYANAKAKKRDLTGERRKIRRRTTSAKMPTPEEIEDAWNRRTESAEAMIHLGGLLHDLECYVDNSLVLGEDGGIICRHRGIRGWLDEHLPSLAPRYKAMMNYKSMAKKIRQVMKVFDPTPTGELLRRGALRPLLDEFEAESDANPNRGRYDNITAVLNRRLKQLEEFLNK